MKRKGKLDHRVVKEIEGVLKGKHTELRESVRSVLTRRHANAAGRAGDYAARATETLHEEIQVAIMDRQSRHLDQVQAALERLRRREYGTCDDCGEFIGLARLRALPFAQRCRPCQSRAELYENSETTAYLPAWAETGS